MKTLDKYVYEGLFSKRADDDTPDIAKQISNIKTVSIPTTKMSFLNYLCALHGIIFKLLSHPQAQIYLDILIDQYFDTCQNFHIELSNQEIADIQYEAVNLAAIKFNGYHSSWDETLVKNGGVKNIREDIKKNLANAFRYDDIYKYLGIMYANGDEKAQKIIMTLIDAREMVLKQMKNKYHIDRPGTNRAKNIKEIDNYTQEILDNMNGILKFKYPNYEEVHIRI